MSSSALASSLRLLRGKLAAQQHNDDSDEQLLHAFLTHRDDNAFAVLLRRYGPMVLHVCCRVLRHEQDAEDAFQATFLVLARSAAKLRKKPSLASWLYGIAYRISLKAKQAAARRRKHEGQASSRAPADPADELSWREVRALVDEETVRLPEIYRSVFILCCLENIGREEAARRLSINEGTLSSRLAKARKRLSQRLARRGVELTAVLAAPALATPSASALPPLLVASTIAAARSEGAARLVSANVAALAKSAASSTMLSKTKIVMAVLLIVATSGSLVSSYRQANEPFAATSEPPRAERNNDEPTPPRKKNEVTTVKGRVLGPDGKPIKGARLYSAQVQNIWPRRDATVALAQPAPTGADGRFHITTQRPDPNKLVYLIALAAGFGVDWIDLGEGDLSREVTLRLVKDVPITGRVVNTEGRPIAGATVSAARIYVATNEKLDDYLAGWLQNFRISPANTALQKLLPVPLDTITGKATTDKDGRFTLRGAGSERIVLAALSGAGVARTTPWIITRPDFDATPYNAVLREKQNEYLLKWNRFPGLYSPSFTFVAEAGKAIEGTVKDAATGKPLAGCLLSTQTSYGHEVAVVSDAAGKYRIDGLAKRADGYHLYVRPPKDTAYLGRTIAAAEDAIGLATIRRNIELAEGAIVTGRVVDRQTGKPVRCYVRSRPLPDDRPAGALAAGDPIFSIDESGYFRLVAIPGKTLLMADAYRTERLYGQPLNVYRRAFPDPEHRGIFQRSGESWRVATAAGDLEYLDLDNAAKVVKIKQKGENRVEMFVDRGTTVRIAVQDSEGKPLAGAWATGLTHTGGTAYKLPEATATVYALNPVKPPKVPLFPALVSALAPDSSRTLAFFHADKKLGGTATVRGDEPAPVVVKLSPLGKVSGRLLDGDGNPLEGVEISVVAHSRIGRDLYHSVTPTGKRIRTDKAGRFRIDGFVPGLQFLLDMRRDRTSFAGEPRIGVRQVKPGETLDLGSVRVKPVR